MAKRVFLIDEYRSLAKDVKGISRNIKDFLDLADRAMKFRVGEVETSYLMDTLVDNRSLISSMIRFAKSPYDSVYVEFEVPKEPELTSQMVRVGVVIIEGTYRIFWEDSSNSGIKFLYEFYLVEVDNEFGLFVPKDRGKEIDQENKELLWAKLTNYAHMCLLLWLLMHQPKVVKVDQVPTKQVLVKGKLRPWKAHNVVTIDVSQKINKKMIQNNGSRGPVREHPVRGHWTHIGLSSSCTHKWVKAETVEGRPERYQCEHCKGLRVWRKPHYRGDAKLGMKFPTYEIKTSAAEKRA